MNTKEAVAKRILELCDERRITANEMAGIAGIPPSTVYSMLGSKSQNPGIVTIKQLCDGLEIELPDFFEAPYFRGLEQEIK